MIYNCFFYQPFQSIWRHLWTSTKIFFIQLFFRHRLKGFEDDDVNRKISGSILAQLHVKQDPFESNDSFEIMVTILTTNLIDTDRISWTVL